MSSVARKIFVAGSAILLVPALLQAQRRSGEARMAPAVAATPGAPQSAAAPSNGGVRRPTSGRIEIGDGGTNPTVVLALGETTLFRCPEPPLQLVFGEPAAFQVVEASAESKRSDFYLIPLRAGVRTGLWIEMASGVVQARLQTVAGNTLTAEYHAEVEVRPPAYRDSLATLREQFAAAETKCREAEAEAQKQLAAVERRAAEQKRSATQTGLELMTALSQTKLKLKARLARARAGPVMVKQLTPALQDSRGSLWTVIELQVKSGKHDPIPVLDRIVTSDSALQTVTTIPFPEPLVRGRPRRIAIGICPAEGAPAVSRASALVFMFRGGGTLNLPLTR